MGCVGHDPVCSMVPSVLLYVWSRAFLCLPFWLLCLDSLPRSLHDDGRAHAFMSASMGDALLMGEVPVQT